ncbi:hypothetical protein PENSPDRAFT_601658 [Peniophora sp. CONT]|nr:hypothetical protein PENSPDRAFT_601658 [Peniophora sp. CONT]
MEDTLELVSPDIARAQVNELLGEGRKSLAKRDHQHATNLIAKAASLLVGKGSVIPQDPRSGGIVSTRYQQMDEEQLFLLLSCCYDVSYSLWQTSNGAEALKWLEEMEAIYRNVHIRQKPARFDWDFVTVNNPDASELRVKGLRLQSDIFLALLNTGMALQRIFVADQFRQHAGLNSYNIRNVAGPGPLSAMSQWRHPDPKLTKDHQLQYPDLQIRGSWLKLPLKKSSAVGGRQGFAHFVWKGRFYVLAGSRAAAGPWMHDFFYMTLARPQDGWTELPYYPMANTEYMATISQRQMCVDETAGKAYFFTSQKQLDVFDLSANTWSRVHTRIDGSFPIDRHYGEFAMVIARNRLYVFGGDSPDQVIGSNVFMMCDLETKRWTHYGGDAFRLKPDANWPGPRKWPSLWVDKDEERVYLIFGDGDRFGATQQGQKGAADLSHLYDDCWSWDITGEKWRRERIPGNAPCPRSEAGLTYNRKLDKVVAYGGYNASLPYDSPMGQRFFFSYFADTFIYDPHPADGSSPAWKQVITRGFPTYRAQCAVFSDSESGKIYMFGGYTNSQFVPDKKNFISRSFGDLWQLRLDIPGGDFEGVDVEEEARTAKQGPWQRCYACGSTGPWKKCGGSCNGRVFFCDTDCQKDGWKEHKQTHGCTARKK